MLVKAFRFVWLHSIAVTLVVGVASESIAQNLTNQNSVAVPGGLSFSEFKGYEKWEVISVSRTDKVLASIVGNPTMIKAYREGFPRNGKPAPDGAKMAKVHWIPKSNPYFPGASVPGVLLNVDFMVKDAKRFADSGGWGYALFDYDAPSNTYRPGTTASKPPQGQDAKCGFACHTVVKTTDYVFTEFGNR